MPSPFPQSGLTKEKIESSLKLPALGTIPFVQNIFVDAINLGQPPVHHRPKELILGLLASNGKLRQAVSLISTAQAIFNKMDTQLDPLDRAEYDHNLEIVRTQLDKTSFENAWAEGRAIRLMDAIEFALEDN
jgi:hypothetical protein